MKKILIAISLLLTAHGLYAQESLTIEVKTAGTLGTLVQEANPNYLSEVKQLTLSGSTNSGRRCRIPFGIQFCHEFIR